VRRAARRRHADFLAFELRQRFDRRAVEHDELNLGDLRGEEDPDRHTVGRGAERPGGARAEGDVDRVRYEPLGGTVDVGELDPLHFQPLFLEELHLLDGRAEAEAYAARPVADPDFLRMHRGREPRENRQNDHQRSPALLRHRVLPGNWFGRSNIQHFVRVVTCAACCRVAT
jgi:hypothetical protein